ncbi:hypothetical protein [Polyangium mundeleinium]|uniref:Uncharacterized protein n=1 Tax=Polyangium mundeleinium TaxID=2995306 RepID=A0ABT5EQ00_9BACT|nr:hypothetical protein [Polyangium mundeleinium]MDC0743912.1 hypothetical protein [Polyangium mundeleinium]
MPTTTTPAKLSRAEKAAICRKLHDNLVVRAQMGPPEPALDAFIPQLDATATRLEAHVAGKYAASAARAAYAERVEEADVEVDTVACHIESFFDNEGHRRQGPHVAAVRAIHAAAFPTGRAFLDARVPEENAEIRRILAVLRAPEHAATLAGISFPMEWITRLEYAVGESDLAYAERASARGTAGHHVNLGKDAEAHWLDVVGRLRKHVESRAPAGDVERSLEGRALLAPLTDAMAHAKAVAAARATRRTKKAEEPPAEPPSSIDFARP